MNQRKLRNPNRRGMSIRLVRLWLIPAAILVGLPLHVVSLPRPASIQDRNCDPQLKQAVEDANGYRPRGDRCEGVYIREVASTELLVASLTETVEDFNAANGKPLLMEWTAPGDGEVQIRAHSLRHRLYYRMDTVRPPGVRSYTWPTNLLSTFNLRKKELGFIARSACAVGSATRDVYVPLRVRQGQGSRSSSYQLVLLPGVELSEVFISLAPVGTDGRNGRFIKKDEPLKYSYYPAGGVVTVSLPVLVTPGIYYLEINALRKNGGPASAPPIWFSHSAR